MLKSLNSANLPVQATRSAAPAGLAAPADTYVPSQDGWLASARTELEVNQAWLARWQANNPWDTFHSPPPPAARKLWASPKRLTTEEKKTLKKLIARGIKEKYARQLVERKETHWIKIMLRRPERKK